MLFKPQRYMCSSLTNQVTELCVKSLTGISCLCTIYSQYLGFHVHEKVVCK